MANTAILQDIFNVLKLTMPKMPKTKQFCETSLSFEVGNIKSEAILRDFFKNAKVSAELTASYQCVLRFLHSIWSAALVTQNHLTKLEDLMLQNATPLRKSTPVPPNISDEHVSGTAPATRNTCLQIFFKCPMPAIVFGNATKAIRFAHFWRGAQSLPPAAQKDIWTSKSAPYPSVFPHITVWGSFFSLGSRLFPFPPLPPLPPPKSHLTHQITPHSTHHSSQSQLHSSQLPRLNSSQLYFSPSTHHSSSRGRRSTQSLLDELRRAWPPLGRGCLSCGRRSTQSLLDKLRRAWPLLGRGCLSCGRRSTQSFLEQLRRAWPPLGRGFLSYHSSQLHLSHHNFSSQLITTSHIPTHHSSTSHTSPITAPLLITTHHSSTSHRSTSHHFSQVHFSSQLITTYHIPTHHTSTSLTSLITSQLLITTHHHLSHPNSSQLHFSHHFSHLTYRIRTHHSSTSHTWHHKSTSHTSLLTPPRSSH